MIACRVKVFACSGFGRGALSLLLLHLVPALHYPACSEANEASVFTFAWLEEASQGWVLSASD